MMPLCPASSQHLPTQPIPTIYGMPLWKNDRPTRVQDILHGASSAIRWGIKFGMALSIANPECEAESGTRRRRRCQFLIVPGAGHLLEYRYSAGHRSGATDAGGSVKHFVEVNSWPPEPGKTISVSGGLTARCSVWQCTYARIKTATFEALAAPAAGWRAKIEYVSPNVYPQEILLLSAECETPCSESL